MSDFIWTASDAAAATGGKTDGSWLASGLSIDTRSLVKGDLFVCLLYTSPSPRDLSTSRMPSSA